MAKRPFVVKFYAYFFIGIAVSFPLQISMLYDIPFTHFSSLLHKLTVLNVMVMCTSLFCAYLIYNVSTYSYFFTMLFAALVFGNNIWVGQVGVDYSMFQSISSSVILSFSLIFLFNDKITNLIQNQNLIWWKQSPRKEVCLPVSVSPWAGDDICLNSFDISETGVFLNWDIHQINKDNFYFETGQHVHIKFNLSQLVSFECNATVVRKKTLPSGRYPAGIGIQFESLDRKRKKRLSSFLSSYNQNLKTLSL